ncbi:hypothetical protein QMK61_00150 [Fulvimonas sp. R45]|uniref:hypothetical protein n=1 Tax=Fulvimonas sp. R45 TaxID=3045937 RepID=UPI0026603211|nr:hypothetical protein [Fulvimonas sp. R45]MDO1527231.1 hypothetical protein [Fulvimonas sp. R45]
MIAKNSEIKSLFLKGIARMALFLPGCAIVLILCYCVGEWMIEHGARELLFLPVTASFMACLYLAKWCLGKILSEMVRLKKG